MSTKLGLELNKWQACLRLNISIAHRVVIYDQNASRKESTVHVGERMAI